MAKKPVKKTSSSKLPSFSELQKVLSDEFDTNLDKRIIDEVLEVLQDFFEKGETILTEISRKFTGAALSELLQEAGFSLRKHFVPDNNYFSLVLASPATWEGE